MTTMVGTVSPFDGTSQLWDEYIEMLEYFFQANEIEGADKKKAVLLSGVGGFHIQFIKKFALP